MLSHKRAVLAAAFVCLIASTIQAKNFGRAATADEIKLWDIDVAPDGTGLPPGGGTVARGKAVYETNCIGCHGPGGMGGVKDRLVGGEGTLTSDKPVKTVGSYWPYATTLFDYIRRAMPYTAPGSLSVDDTYALTAFILNLNGLLPDDGKIDEKRLPAISMPNRDGFIPDDVFNVDNESQGL